MRCRLAATSSRQQEDSTHKSIHNHQNIADISCNAIAQEQCNVIQGIEEKQEEVAEQCDVIQGLEKNQEEVANPTQLQHIAAINCNVIEEREITEEENDKPAEQGATHIDDTTSSTGKQTIDQYYAN